VVGEWEAGDDRPIGEQEVAVAELKGYLMRRYAHRGTGEVVEVLVVCGRGGPVAAHTPDVCFAGQGYAQTGAAQRHPVEVPGADGKAEFWAGRFEKPSVNGPGALGILWTWSARDRWEAPENARLEFGRFPAVYKLYVIRPLGEKAGGPAQDPVVADFLRAFLPAAQTALFRPTE
jgi:hypothetical protein